LSHCSLVLLGKSLREEIEDERYIGVLLLISHVLEISQEGRLSLI
jgi:hypothetical protein